MKRMSATAPKRLSFIRLPHGPHDRGQAYVYTFATVAACGVPAAKPLNPVVAEHAHGVKIKGIGVPQRGAPTPHKTGYR